MANIAFFDIPADNVERAKHFYTSLLGGKINLGRTTPDQAAIAAMQYHAVLTGEAREETMNRGGLYKRQGNETIKTTSRSTITTRCSRRWRNSAGQS
jgi:predicted enzyme related to lactoylglutathione lyase